MDRRTLLEAAGGTAVLGSSMLSGCLGSAGETPAGGCDTDESAHRWRYGVGGVLDTVADGTVLARKNPIGVQGPTDAVVALDAASGERRWSYESAMGGMDRYTDLTVSDGVYFSLCSDDDCLPLYALEIDGEQRWVRDIDAGFRRPLVADGVVYVANDTGYVQGLEAATGETRWSHREPSDGGAEIVDVADAVYLETNAALTALDGDEGDRLWRYEPGAEQIITGATVSNGVAYLVTYEQVAAVADGDELWRRDESGAHVRRAIAGFAAGHLFVIAGNGSDDYRLHAIDAATGERAWVSGLFDHPNVEYSPQVAIHDEVVYVGSEGVRALDTATGSERWSVALDCGPILSMTAVEASGVGGRAVVAQAGETRLVSLAPDGEQLWELTVDGKIRDHLVGELVFVATEERIYGFDPRDDQ